MTHFKKLIILTLSALLLCANASAETACRGDTTLTINGKKLVAEIAATERERRYGLMFRTTMGTDCGMLFIFQNERVRTFTMRNTLIPLDIAFISTDGTIKEIFTMQPGVPRYPSAVESKYALEMNAGWFDQNSLQIGKQISLFTGGTKSSLSEVVSDK